MWSSWPFCVMLRPPQSHTRPPAIGVRAHGGPQGGVEDCGEPRGTTRRHSGGNGPNSCMYAMQHGRVVQYKSRVFYNRHLASMTPLNKLQNKQNLVAANDSALTTIGKIKVVVRGKNPTNQRAQFSLQLQGDSAPPFVTPRRLPDHCHQTMGAASWFKPPEGRPTGEENLWTPISHFLRLALTPSLNCPTLLSLVVPRPTSSYQTAT